MTKRFITIEGIEGVGKSTLVEFLKQWFDDAGLLNTFTREPGGTPIAEGIRELLLKPHADPMHHDTELLLVFAARAQHISEVILPALQQGHWVVSDRFTDASYAYQGGGRGISLQRIAQLESWVQGDLQPSLTLLLDAPLDIAFSRAHSRSLPDRIEQEGMVFFEKVRKQYLQRAKEFSNRFVIIDASQDLSKVKKSVLEVITRVVSSI